MNCRGLRGKISITPFSISRKVPQTYTFIEKWRQAKRFENSIGKVVSLTEF